RQPTAAQEPDHEDALLAVAGSKGPGHGGVRRPAGDALPLHQSAGDPQREEARRQPELHARDARRVPRVLGEPLLRAQPAFPLSEAPRPPAFAVPALLLHLGLVLLIVALAADPLGRLWRAVVSPVSFSDEVANPAWILALLFAAVF